MTVLISLYNVNKTMIHISMMACCFALKNMAPNAFYFFKLLPQLRVKAGLIYISLLSWV